MKKYVIEMAIILLASSLSGCATTPTPEQFAKAYYGPEPTDYETIIKNHMVTILRDSSSAIYQFKKPPYKGYIFVFGDSPFGTPEFGWIVETNINAKNGFGGYTGFKPANFLIRDNRVITWTEFPMKN